MVVLVVGAVVGYYGIKGCGGDVGGFCKGVICDCCKSALVKWCL